MFKQCIIVEPVGMNENAQARLRRLAEEVIEYPDSPASEAELIKRIGQADCVLVSWRTEIPASVLRQCPSSTSGCAAVCIRKRAPTSISPRRANWASR